MVNRQREGIEKIDAIVALAMACCPAMEHRGEIGSRATRGFNASAHVAKETIEPFRGPIYVAQTLEMPAAIIAQSDCGGITVLAAFTIRK